MKEELSPFAQLVAKILLVAAFVLLAACGKDDDSSSPSTPAVDSNITLLTHPQDPLILKINKESEGEGIIEYYGTRGSDGLPVRLDQIRQIKDNQESVVGFNEDNRINYIRAFNGVQFYMEWQSNTKFILTAVTPDESFQLNTPVDLNDSETSAWNNAVSPNTRSGNIHLTESTRKQVQVKSFSKTQDDMNSYFTLTKCGPFKAENWVEVRSEAGDFIRRLPTHEVALGKYSYLVPSDISGSINPQDLCNATGEVLDMVCELSNGIPGGIYLMGTTMCTAISAAIAITGIGAAIAAPIFTACESLAIGLEVYCDVPALSTLCDEYNFLDIDIYQYPEIVLNGAVLGDPQNFVTSPVTVSSQGPFPDLSLQLPATTKINTLNVNPAAPMQDQDYQVVAEIGCLTAGTTVKLTVTGTDDYYDEVNYTVSEAEENKEFILGVPGAEQGVRDVIQLEVTGIDGTSLKRTAVLVFQKLELIP